jgi:hypothetical protein
MDITVRGWGRDQGATTIMSARLSDAETPDGSYSRGKLYKAVVYPEHKRLTKVRISTSTEVRLGGTYLLHVELSRKEIAQLFYETHSGAMVRMIKSFIEDEAREEAARMLERLRQRDEHRQEPATEEQDAEQ